MRPQPLPAPLVPLGPAVLVAAVGPPPPSSTTGAGGGALRARFRVERPDFRFFPALPFFFLEERFFGGLGGPANCSHR